MFDNNINITPYIWSIYLMLLVCILYNKKMYELVLRTSSSKSVSWSRFAPLTLKLHNNIWQVGGTKQMAAFVAVLKYILDFKRIICWWIVKFSRISSSLQRRANNAKNTKTCSRFAPFTTLKQNLPWGGGVSLDPLEKARAPSISSKYQKPGHDFNSRAAPASTVLLQKLSPHYFQRIQLI